MIYILIIIVLVFLWLIYGKLSELLKFFNADEGREEKDRKRMNFENWLYREIKEIKYKVTELSEVATVENPAWGKNSAEAKKNENLIKLTAQDLVNKENMTKEDALVKAKFIVTAFERTDSLISESRREIKFAEEGKSEEEVRLSDFFKKEVETVSQSLKPQHLYEPLYYLIKTEKVKKDDELYQNTQSAFGAHSPRYGYSEFVNSSAVISKLEELGLIKKGREWAIKGRYSYHLIENDLNKIRSVIFTRREDNENWDDAYFDGRDVKLSNLPITNSMLHV